MRVTAPPVAKIVFGKFRRAQRGAVYEIYLLGGSKMGLSVFSRIVLAHWVVLRSGG